MDEGLSKEELKRVHAIRDQYIEGEAPTIVTSLFIGAFKTTPWIPHNNSNDNETHLNNTIETIDSENTIPYDTFDKVKTQSLEENDTTTTTTTSTSTKIKKEA